MFDISRYETLAGLVTAHTQYLNDSYLFPFLSLFERHNHDAAEKICAPKMGSEENLESNGVCMKYENEKVRGIKSMGKVKSEKCILPKSWCT